ncbi:MAG: alpha/beta hydrolase [Anaerolineaceae bacterium]|nr:alpha/beta hydrolase [Anaerolineaceae bacterium]
MKCNVKDIPIYYEIHGSGKPILMIHGFTPDHRLMSGCMEPLFAEDDGWQRIYLDLPGMGQTPAPVWLTTSDQMLEIVYQFVRQVIPDQKYAVAGESYGGYLTLGLLRKDGQHIIGAMLLCPLTIGVEEQRTLPARTACIRDEALLESLSDSDRESFEAFCVIQTKEVWEKMNADISSGVAIADFAFLEKLSKVENYPFTYESELSTLKYEKPMLILTGRQDTAVGFEDHLPLVKQYPHATFLALDRAGHNLQIEQPLVFNALTREWLNSMQTNWKDS